LAAILIIAMVLVILCHTRTARQSQQRRHTSSPLPLCLHKFSLIRTGIPIFKHWVAVSVCFSALLLHNLNNRGRSTCQFIAAHRFGQNCSARFMGGVPAKNSIDHKKQPIHRGVKESRE
jgi:hypothetical protein